MFKLDSYFFDATDYQTKPNTTGKTRRSPFTGKLHTDWTVEYKTFELTIEDVDTILHSHFLYLKDKYKAGNTLFFTDDVGNQYEVVIPVGGYDFKRERGEGEYYTWSLTLEEVIV